MRIVLTGLFLTATLGAQSLIEHAIVTGPAASGSTAGALMGSKLGATLESTAKKLEQASKQGKETKVLPVERRAAQPAQQAGTSTFAPAPQPGSGRPARVVWTRDMEKTVAAADPASAPGTAAATTPAQPVTPPSPPPPSKDELLAQLATIETGSSRVDLVAKLGKPASTISMYDDGHFVERFRFRTGREDLAQIIVTDGKVSTINRLAQ